ncbi:ABC transporter substrate-binding protein [Clostridium rectalis]|uniref:ABC transporter substrate-binding protein n=1 Tax=Clostridium rectalis TaxID=2040295 RepID=UPI000F62FDB9|nr:ABC transporter substrate-binding protein [Clostridium rectalis]
MHKIFFNKKTILNKLLILVMVLSVSLSGCGSNTKNRTEKTDNNKEIILASPRDITSGKENIHFTNVISYVWEPLITMDKNGQPSPKLATSWEMSKDGKQWTFKLQQGVTFHKGEKFNADIVVANFNRYKKLKNGKSNFYTFKVDKIYKGLVDCVKIDDYTVTLTFKNPLPTLPYNMVNFGSPIFHPKDFGTDGNFIVDIPNATGPFKLSEYKKDSYCILESNETYWGEKAKSKKIKIKTIPDAQTRFSALKSGEIMGVLDLGAIPPNLAKELLKDDKFQSSYEKSTISHYLYANGNKAPFNNVKMKQAISLALDRDLIVNKFYNDFGKPTQNILNYTSPFYNNIKAEHNLEKAKKLSSEVLKGNTININLIVPAHLVKAYPYKEEAEYIQSALKPLGLNVSIINCELAASREIAKKGDFHLFMDRRGLPNMEPYTILETHMKSTGDTNKEYNLGYSNFHVDELLSTATKTMDMKKRKDIYNKLQNISSIELPTIPLFNEVNLVVYNKKVTGHDALIYGTTLPKLKWSK